MRAPKKEVQTLLDKLPDDCGFDDVQYPLYVIAKELRGIQVANAYDNLSQYEIEPRLAEWTSK